MKRLLVSCLLVAGCLTVSAQTKTTITRFNLSGPHAVMMPAAADTVDVQGKKFDDKSFLKAVSLSAPVTRTFEGAVLPSLDDSHSVGVLTFYVNNPSYLKGKIEVKGPKQSQLYIDEQEADGTLSLAPDHHVFAVKYLAEAAAADSIQVTIDANLPVAYTLDVRHPYVFKDLTDGKRIRDTRLSADGAYIVMSYQTTESGGATSWSYELREVKTGRLLSLLPKSVVWLPKTVAYLDEETFNGHRSLYKVDPLTGMRTLFAKDIPEGRYEVSPTEDYLILSLEEEGPKEDPGVYEVLEMDDRQPGWRKRNYLAKYDIATGVTQRLTFGHHNAMLEDISADGCRLLVGAAYSRLGKRPTEVSDALIIDLRTLKADTLFVSEGFIGGGMFSPDGRQILFSGTPEAFNRIGCQLPASVTPSMVETELFAYDLATRQVTPLTKDFDPSISMADWSKADGQIYFTAEDRDYVRLFSLNPKTGAITRQPAGGDYVYRFDLAAQVPVITYLSYETMAPASAYVLNLKTRKQQTVFDGRSLIAETILGTCEDWNFESSRGYTVYGRLYLPADFDASRQYPMIVNYYGGCSPTSRYFESRYPAQYWNSLGYVVYVIQPSGATGFGQEWASRHVNTAGRGPADDIIEGTKKLCATHPFINAKKIGCIGASYGGFMTMYLQTVTDIFACAVSHAGISNHTSYWGEGYWGYNYSEVSMANSYPWSHRQLFVDQSPLFNADKIHTPLLLLHGTGDTNVPLVESLQMFTALKLLGREVALVEVEGENHHILDYDKREKWVATQMAWFAKWLQDDPTWWEALYPKKRL
ncbi:MAG: S9 family peptidase [Prevotella sp.]|nr:S9 family peptidase [Prevotella sp.]